MRYYCSKDCPDTCSFDLSLSPEGRPLFIPEKKYYNTPPFVCAKLRRFYDVESSFEPGSFFLDAGHKINISDKEAVEKAAKLIQLHQRGRILFMRGSGSLSWRMSCWDALLAKLEQVWFVKGSPCDETGISAHMKDFSVCMNPPVNRIEEANTVILFGKNAKVTSPHFYTFLKRLSKRETRVVYIDPVETGTSSMADRYIRILPAGDGLLCAAILSRLGLENSLNWQELRDRAGVLPQDLDYLSALFAKKEKIAMVTGFSLQRYANGMNSVRWINRLAALTQNSDLLYYGKSSKEGMESPGVSPANRIPIAELPERLRQNFFDLIIVAGANPCVTYPESTTWAQALADTPLIVADVRNTETTACADLFLRVSGMFGQEDAQGSYFFNDDVRVRLKGFLSHHLSDAETVSLLAKSMGMELRIKGVQEIGRTDEAPLRNYATSTLEAVPPLYEPGYRLLTVSHPLCLNSQLGFKPDKDACLFVSEEVAYKEGLIDGQPVRVKNNIGFFETICNVTSMLKGPVVMAYKNQPFQVNWANHVVKSSATDAGTGLDYYDTFVELEKI